MKKIILVLCSFTAITLSAQQPPENNRAIQQPTTPAALVHITFEQDDTTENTPLHKVQNSQEAEALIQAGADINARNNLRHTPLHIAVNKGHKDIVALLIQEGAETHATDIWLRTPVEMAYSMEMVAFFTQCLENKQSKN